MCVFIYIYIKIYCSPEVREFRCSVCVCGGEGWGDVCVFVVCV